MRLRLILTLCFAASVGVHAVDKDDITWQIRYDGKSLPASPTWKAQGNPKATV